MIAKRAICVALALVAACSGDKKSNQKSGKKSPPTEATPPKLTPEPPADPGDPMAAWEAHAAAANARDMTALKALYADDAETIPVGAGMVAKGPEQILEFFSSYWDAFPDTTSEPYVVLVNGKTHAAVARVRGTHTKEMMGLPAKLRRARNRRPRRHRKDPQANAVRRQPQLHGSARPVGGPASRLR
jgi:ketosteroid isomerase-like protein